MFTILIVVLLVKPTGLLGQTVREKDLGVASPGGNQPCSLLSCPDDAWKAAGPLAVCVLLALGAHFWLGPRLGDFSSRILMDVGIAITLAVSLNIVNGFTGQFSIGHAGFLVVGGYAAGAVTHYGTLLIWGDTTTHGGLCGPGGHAVPARLLAWRPDGGRCGLHRRPAFDATGGDYLAIVTLGFGEIIRVLLQQTNDVLFTPAELRSATFRQLLPPPVG